MGNVTEAHAAIDAAVEQNTLTWEQGVTWKDTVNRGISAEGALATANGLGGQMGRDYLKSVTEYEGRSPITGEKENRPFSDQDKQKMIAAYDDALSAKGKDFIAGLDQQFSQNPEAFVDPEQKAIEISAAKLSSSDEAKALGMVDDHNADVIYAKYSDALSSSSTVDDVAGVLFNLEHSGAIWKGRKAEKDRWQLESDARSLLKAITDDGAGSDAAKTAAAHYDIQSIYWGVMRADNPSEADRRGAFLAIDRKVRQYAAQGIDLTSTANSYYEKLGAVPAKVAEASKSSEQLFYTAIGKKTGLGLTAEEIQQRTNFTRTIYDMSTSGNFTQEQIDEYVNGYTRDLASKSFAVMRVPKITTDNLLPAAALMQSGGLKYESVLAAGVQHDDPTTVAARSQVTQEMTKVVTDLGFQSVVPVTMSDGSVEFNAKWPGIAQTYRLRPSVDLPGKKMVINEFVQSSKAWKPWTDPGTKKPGEFKPVAPAPGNADRSEIKKIMSGLGSASPTEVGTQLAQAVLEGRVKKNEVYTSGSVDAAYFDSFESELKRLSDEKAAKAKGTK
jgi:hypothetical protein